MIELPKVVFDVEDNKIAITLFGEQDCNLKYIEKSLGLKINARGNIAFIEGRDAERARIVLKDLINMIPVKKSLGFEEVDAAIRFSLEETKSSSKGIINTPKKKIISRTVMQGKYIEALKKYELTFGLGPAGTGKTYLAVAVAAEHLLLGNVKKIILSRPAVEAGEQLGFLPGDLKEKVDPYLRPLYDALIDCMGKDKLVKMIDSGKIEIAPLAFMRGRTLSNAFIILDEAQNTSAMQMKMFLTRLGYCSKMAITGDLSQVDLPNPIQSGLFEALTVTKNIKNVNHIYFGETDVIRHPLVAKIVKSYNSLKLFKK